MFNMEKCIRWKSPEMYHNKERIEHISSDNSFEEYTTASFMHGTCGFVCELECNTMCIQSIDTGCIVM